MRIGIDVDGVLANFSADYAKLIVETTGRNLFHPGDTVNPPVWDWEKLRGYTDEEIKDVWKIIKASETFWADLEPLVGGLFLASRIEWVDKWHDIYYVTARVGNDAKWQTEMWLNTVCGVPLPTVLLSKDKGAVCKALDLNIYVDDNLENIEGVELHSPQTHAYLLNYNYNQARPVKRRVTTLEDVFFQERL